MSTAIFPRTPESMSGNQQRKHASSLPMQEPVPSASVLPPKPPPFQPTQPLNQPMLPHTASQQYVEQHQAFSEHQRKLHEEERALWKLEREELHQKIRTLEATIRNLRSASEPSSRSFMNHDPEISAYANIFPTFGSAGLVSPKNDLWQGRKSTSDSKPRRSLPAASGTFSTSGRSSSGQLSSISEEQPPYRKKSVGFQGVNPPSPSAPQPSKASIPGEEVDANLDGITFRASVVHSTWAPDSSTGPLKSPSPGSISPGQKPKVMPRPQLLNLPTSSLTPDQLLTKDAGHTPLARVADEASKGSSANTPVAGQAEGSNAPRPSGAPKLPTERSDSYFPAAPPETRDEDPALKEPLGLGSDPAAAVNSSFLNQLDSRLRGVQTESAVTSSSSSEELNPRTKEQIGIEGTANGHGAGRHDPAQAKDDGDEEGPKLRIKRSLNFGTVFGARTIGSDA